MIKTSIKKGLVGGIVAMSLALTSLPLMASGNPSLAPDNLARSEGKILSVIDSTRFVMKVDSEEQYRRMKLAAGGDRDRLRFFNDSRQTIEVRMSHVRLPSATRKE